MKVVKIKWAIKSLGYHQCDNGCSLHINEEEAKNYIKKREEVEETNIYIESSYKSMIMNEEIIEIQDKEIIKKLKENKNVYIKEGMMRRVLKC
jgi:hypothetical protein